MAISGVWIFHGIFTARVVVSRGGDAMVLALQMFWNHSHRDSSKKFSRRSADTRQALSLLAGPPAGERQEGCANLKANSSASGDSCCGHGIDGRGATKQSFRK
jgi:hypothetical protein